MVNVQVSAKFKLATATKQLYRKLHDVETPKGLWRAGLPEVFPLNGERTPFGKGWQLLAYAMNPGMTGDRFRALYGSHKAFNNGTGFPSQDGDEPHADYVNGLDLGYPLPAWDKTRVCGGATLSGREDGTDLIVEILDGFGPPPMLDDLLTHPTLFFHAVNSTATGITKFPQNDGRPCLVPLVGSGVARIPLAELQKVPGLADPYYLGYRPYHSISHEVLNVTSPKAMTVHLYRIDLTRVIPFVTPYLGIKMTPSQFLDLYNMDLVINGDGGPWLNGALLSAGRWMTKGTWISQDIGENSIWFDSAARCRMSYSAPSGFTPYNVISGPKLMISAGVFTNTFDDTFIAARSAFGLFNDTSACVIAIEGQEFTEVGATEQSLALLGRDLLHLQYMMELDSGGSTGVAFSHGTSYSVEDRKVLNALCFKEKI